MKSSSAKTPTVSVIMPVFNAGQYIEPATRSILEQTFEDLELILVDDCSTDGTLEIIAGFRDPRVIVLKHDANHGYPTAMNTGLARARGEFIARMDSDDLSTPLRLERQVEFIREHPDYALVGTRFSFITPKGYFCRNYVSGDSDYGAKVDSENSFFCESWESVKGGRRRFADPSILARKEDIFRAGGYRTYQRSGQDVDLWLRLLEKNDKAVTLNAVLYYRRLHLEMMSLSKELSASNKIPRFLAEERMASGEDSVMRGNFDPGVIGQNIESRPLYWRLMGLWNAAEFCFRARDYSSAMNFVLKAFFMGKLARVNLARLWRIAKLQSGLK